MNAQQYIQEKLLELTAFEPNFELNDDTPEKIKKLLLSKKFRKYAALPQLIENVDSAISIAMQNQKPIEIVFVHGGYKLWRLKESPEVDWAEVFALMYYIRWLLPVCEVYEHGVHFDLYVDDYIVPILDNISQADVDSYIQSERELISFLKSYMPHNLHMTVTTVGSQFSDIQDFNTSLMKNFDTLEEHQPYVSIQLSEAQEKMIDLNVKLSDTDTREPFWKQKIQQLHDAYSMTKKETKYYYRPDKIIAFCLPLGNGLAIALGTTKDSVAKFWVGVGALKPQADSYRQIILTPSQLATSQYELQDINVKGLYTKNFKNIRVLL